MMQNNLLVICGPTASGKSYLGHHLARIYNGEIVNGDSMQIYQQIPIITASPPEIYKDEIPYHLYNFISIEQEFSVIKYVNYALEKITDISERGKLPIIIGGTGLYINSLLFGYNEIPSISAEIKQCVRDLHITIGQVEFFQKLIELDPLAKQKLNQLDSQRSIRAYEVFEQTGQSIFTFQAKNNINILGEFAPKVIFLHPERKFLYQTCDDRLVKLFNDGAINEIENIIKTYTNFDISKIKAIGAKQIAAYLKNEISLQEAILTAQTKTKQYAKRQITWFKHQIKEKVILEYSNNQEFEELISKIHVSDR